MSFVDHIHSLFVWQAYFGQ